MWSRSCRCLIFLLLSCTAVAAEPSAMKQPPLESGLPEIRKFDSLQYQGHGQNWAFAQGRDGLLYFGNTLGVLQFDSLRWQLYELPNRAIVRSLASDAQSGRIYVGGVGDFGYLEAQPTGGMRYQSLLPLLPADQRDFADVWQTHVSTGHVFFTSYKYLFQLTPDGGLRSFVAPKRFHRSYLLQNRLYIRSDGIGLQRLEQDQLQLVPDGERFAAEPVNALLEWPATGELLAISRNTGFWLYNGQHFRHWATELDVLLQQKLFYQALLLPDGRLALAMLQGGIYLADQQGRWVGLFNSKTGLQDDTVYSLGLDQEQGLWAQSNSGLTRIQLGSGLSRFDERHGLAGTIYMTRRIGGQVYVGTAEGLYTLQAGPEPRLLPVAGLTGQVWALEPVAGQILIGNYQGVYRLNAAGTAAEPVYRSDSTTCFLPVSAPEPLLLAGQREGVVILRPQGRDWQLVGKLADVTDNVRTMVQQGPADLWLGTANNGVIHLHYTSGVLFKGEPRIRRYWLKEGLPGANDNRVILFKKQIRVLTEGGIFMPDTQGARMVPDPAFSELFPDEVRQISRLLDTTTGVWLDTRNATSRISEFGRAVLQANGRYRWQPVAEMAPYRLNGIWQDEEGVLWLGADALYRLVPEQLQAADRAGPVILRSILSPDGPVAHVGTGLQLSYQQNQLRFEFAAPRYRGQNWYAVQLEGVDQHWSEWSTAAFASYNSLWEGQYVLRVRARDPLGHESLMPPLPLSITPPWYRSIAAWLAYLLLFALVLNRWVHWRSTRLRLQAQALELQVSARTAELQQTLTSLKSTQRQLVRSEKMAALGQLVAGVAHEVNTPLGVALTGSSFLRESTTVLAGTLSAGQLRKQDLDSFLSSAVESSQLIERNLQRAADLISNFKQVSVDRSSGERRQFQLRGFLLEVEQSLATLWRNRPVQFLVDCPADIQLDSYPGALSQVITILAQNSLLHGFAADDGGEMRLSVRTLDPQNIEIVFADNGSGIAAEHLEKVFEPFFTTKRAHGGTGLGLHILFNLISERLCGTVSVENGTAENGSAQGCRFIILLPVVAPGPEKTTAADAAV